MALYVNTNSEAIIAQDNLNTTEMALNTSMTDLSSGLRINTAADDSSGYAISEDLTSQVNGLNEATNNANNATSLVQTADSALNDVGQMLQTIRELAVEYQGGTLDSTDQNAIISEVSQLAEQISQITSQSQFNGIYLFDPSQNKAGTAGASGLLTFQVGADAGQVITIHLQTLTSSALLGGIVDGTVAATLGSSSVLTKLTSDIDAVSSLAADFGAVQNRLSYTLDNLSTYSENLTSAQATITDVDMASEETEFTKDQILEQAGISMLSQAEQNPQAVLKLLGT